MNLPEEESRGLNGEEKRPSYELTLDQLVQLEAIYEHCPHPDDTKEDQIAKELGLELEQIKHWFQNKRKTKISQPESEAPTKEETSLANPQTEVAEIIKVANLAMAELLKLVTINEPLWTESSYGVEHVLVREKYANMFPRVDSFSRPHTHEESSKYYKVVRMKARQLVEMLLHSDQWANLFPTIVSKSGTVKLIGVGSMDKQNAVLQVVYEEMHSLSPLVPSRKLLFLRCCQQIGNGTWAIAHVSIDSIDGHVHDFPVRRLPSGCMIYQMNEEFSMVHWIEHVKINDKMETKLDRDLTHNNAVYGAQRWLCALHRMCERFFCTTISNVPPETSQKVMNAFNARMAAMKLSNRMIRSFFEIVYMLRREGFLQSYDEKNYDLKTSLRKNTEPEMPQGIIATAITCIRFPVPPQDIFTLLGEGRKRPKWDLLTCFLPMSEISRFTAGGNHVSIMRTQNDTESNVMIFQDSYTDPLGSYVVYAPISTKNAIMITNGGNSMVSILPSGFLISEDNRAVVKSSKKPRGSLLTMAYQFLICCDEESIQDEHKEIIGRIVVSTLQKITNSLNISED
ncbi:hypothetical protein VNO78_04773 [Psophocarpus tetragonolobus]|uniref:Uncharacterized protein n=1 Tax=Psophocarpus tetragonolobus TaxID=3891 RepID=A0AAN9T3Z0_PSOTE